MNKYIFPVQQKISGNFPEKFLKIFRGNIFPEKLHHYIEGPKQFIVKNLLPVYTVL